MSFKYIQNQPQTAITPPGLAVYAKSFKIDIAAGSSFTSGTSYTLGYLKQGSQFLWGTVQIVTAVAGGTVSAATLALTLGGATIAGAANVFALNTLSTSVHGYTGSSVQESTTDQALVYTPTLTGAGPTVGVIYITLFYAP